MVEHSIRNRAVGGSNPPIGFKLKTLKDKRFRVFALLALSYSADSRQTVSLRSAQESLGIVWAAKPNRLQGSETAGLQDAKK